jgi:hypothetical protein
MEEGRGIGVRPVRPIPEHRDPPGHQVSRDQRGLAAAGGPTTAVRARSHAASSRSKRRSRGNTPVSRGSLSFPETYAPPMMVSLPRCAMAQPSFFSRALRKAQARGAYEPYLKYHGVHNAVKEGEWKGSSCVR